MSKPVVKPKVKKAKKPRAKAAPKVRRPKVRKARASSPPSFNVSASGAAAIVVRWALAQVGKPYVWGTAGPRTFDCSGLILASFARVGIRLPHQSGSIGGMGRSVPRSQWRAGVVVHYAGHVALVVSATMMVEAPHAGASVRVTKIRNGGSGRWLF